MLQVTLTHETTLKQVYGGGGGTSETRANDVWIKEKQESGRGSGGSKKWNAVLVGMATLSVAEKLVQGAAFTSDDQRKADRS